MLQALGIPGPKQGKLRKLHEASTPRRGAAGCHASLGNAPSLKQRSAGWVVDPATAATSVTHVRHAWSSERAVVGRTHAPQFIARKRVAVDVPRRERPPAQAPVEPPREVRRVYSWRVRARRLLVLLPRDAPRRRTAAPRPSKEETAAAARAGSPWRCRSSGRGCRPSSRPSRGRVATPSGLSTCCCC